MTCISVYTIWPLCTKVKSNVESLFSLLKNKVLYVFNCITRYTFCDFVLEKIHLSDKNSLVFNESVFLKKRGRTIWYTIG